MSDERCDAAGCGRRHALETFPTNRQDVTLCGFHRLELGFQEIELRNGDKAMGEVTTKSVRVLQRRIEVRP